VLLAALALSAFVASGCGTEDKLGKSELVEQANAICKPHNEKIETASGELVAGGRPAGKKKRREVVRDTIAPELRAQITELRGLRPADDLAGDYTKWLDDADVALGEISTDPSSLTNPATFETVNREAADLGVSRDCYLGPG